MSKNPTIVDEVTNTYVYSYYKNLIRPKVLGQSQTSRTIYCLAIQLDMTTNQYSGNHMYLILDSIQNVIVLNIEVFREVEVN